MRYTASIAFFLIVLIGKFYSQDNNIDPWIRENYIYDANRLSLNEIYYNDNHIYKDSIIIPSDLIDKYLIYFSSIYSLSDNSIDSIFNIYKIHTLCYMCYGSIQLDVDPTSNWVKEFVKDSIKSGYNEFDSLINKYSLKLDHVFDWLSMPKYSLYLTSHILINYKVLKDKFKDLNDIRAVSFNECFGFDGDNIEIDSTEGIIYIIFSKGWGDCMSGCGARHYWKYMIDSNYNATFIASYGNVISKVLDYNNFGIRVYPNPLNDKIFISNLPINSKVKIYSILGELVFESFDTVNQIDMTYFQSGIYELVIFNEKSIQSIKILKQ